MNIFFIGDELVAGRGDPKALGWTGRVAARTISDGLDPSFCTLAVAGETTAEMAQRWDEEVMRRVHTREPNVVVFGIGRHDIRRKVSRAKTRLYLATTLDQTLDLGFHPVLIGPPPSIPSENDAVSELALVCEEAAARRDVTYVDTYGPLAAHEQWLTDIEAGADGLPGQAGYGLMAWLVLHAGWRTWMAEIAAGPSAPADEPSV